MGAKLSNCSASGRNLPSDGDYVRSQHDLDGSLYPHISLEVPHSDYSIRNPTISETQQCNIRMDNFEPHLFPKISMASQQHPVPNSNCFRIHPIIQKDVKLSETHYWIINEPQHKRCQSARVKRNPPELYVNASSIGNEAYEEPELPYDLNEQISQEYVRTRPVKRGQSEYRKEYPTNIHKGLIIRMMLHIASATESECNSVLIGANWDFDVAEKRLKVDMLHRRGLVNQQRCIQLLGRFKWNLSQASHQAEIEFKQLQFKKPQSSNSSRSHQSDETG